MDSATGDFVTDQKIGCGVQIMGNIVWEITVALPEETLLRAGSLGPPLWKDLGN